MICSTCGKTNADHLTFCEDCGARMKPRIVPPTPPVGLAPPGVQLPQQPVMAPSPSPQPGLVSSPVLPAPAPSAPALGSNACPRCGAAVAPGLRFCTSCGQPLDAQRPPPVAAPSPIAPPVAAPAPIAPKAPAAPVAQAPVAPIAPAPMVELGQKKEPDAPTRACPRCKAQSPATAQFCRYCGTPLSSEPTPVPAPQAQAQPPAKAQPPAQTQPPAQAQAPSAHVVAQPTAPPTTAPPTLGTPPTSPSPQRPQAPPLQLAPPAPPLDQTMQSAPPQFDGNKTTEVAAMAGATAPRGRIVIIARDGGEGPSHPILDQLDIGRSEGDVIVSDDRFLSPRHARIVRRGESVFVRDLWSVNGIYRRVRPGDSGALKLQDQDLILLGQQVLRFEIVKDGEEGFGPAVQHGTLVFGTPVGPRLCSQGGARLAVRSTDGVPRDVHHLRKAETVMGREQGDIVFTDDPFLSRRHAFIRVTDPDGPNPTYALGDLESSNGTFLRIRGEIEIKHGDELRMGQQLFRLDLSGKELAAPIKTLIENAGQHAPEGS